MRKVTLILVALALAAQAFVVRAQNGTLSGIQDTAPTDVHVKLVLVDNKTTFRIGEPIRLVLEFTADTPGYQVDTIEDRTQPTSDAVTISPESGVNHWLDEMMRGVRYPRDVFAPMDLSSIPKRVGLTLNDSLRFDRAGHYTVKVTTRRVSSSSRRASNSEIKPPIVLTTNEVAFDVTAMSDEEEQKQIKRLSDLLNAKHDLQTDENVTQELSFLTGDVSTREKVRRFLNPENRTGNYSAHIWNGLFIARNRDLELQLLETALRDPTQPVDSRLLAAVSNLRLIKENDGGSFEPKVASTLPTDRDPRLGEIQTGYISELAAGLSKRSGKSLTTTAMTILTMSKKETENWQALTRDARRVLMQQFDSLSIYEQESLLQRFWDDLRDPSMIGPLKKLLAPNAVNSRGIRDPILKRLIELSPDEARPFVITEICYPSRPVESDVLGGLNDKSLPEVDSCLLKRLEQLAKSENILYQMMLQRDGALAARYATENIYRDVLQLYRENVATLKPESRAALLAYLAKQNEPETLALIEQSLVDLPPEQDFNFLPKLTKLYYSAGIGELVKKRLETSEPHAASNAAYLLGVHGMAGDEAVLQARLERWRKEWGDRISEADANLQGMIEREVVYALVHGKSWKLSLERVKELQQSCVSKFCRQSNQVP
jgi:hypothetical protein